jgi:two-component system KDP operon response regulator KdpE
MNSARVLIVDDEPEILHTLRTNLTARGYAVSTAESGEEALNAYFHQHPDLLVLDLSMPAMSGMEVIRQVRQHSSVPIIILSVHGAEHYKVMALDAGADDFVTKPFGIDELLARMRAVVRRVVPTPNAQAFESGELHIDVLQRRVLVRGREVHLTPNEYDLLKVLVSQAGKVLTHRTLLREVWGDEFGADSHYLHVYIAQLRRKLELDPMQPKLIITEPGIGYRFRAE